MKKEHFKIYIVMTIIILVIGISIAYATLSQTLKVNTTTTIQSSKTSWNVKITDVTCSDYNYATHGDVQHTDTTVTVSDIVVKAAYSRVECDVTVKNEGEINAELSSFSINTPTYAGTGSSQSEDVKLVKSYFFTRLWFKNTSYTNWTQMTNDKLPIELQSGKEIVIHAGSGLESSLNDLPKNSVTVSDIGVTLIFTQA